MRAAADVLEEARSRFHNDPANSNSGWVANNWTPRDLRKYADAWEQEDAKEADLDQIVEEIAAEIFTMWSPGFDREGEAGSQNLYRNSIRGMLNRHPHIAEGWTKVADLPAIDDLCNDRYADNSTAYYCSKRRGHIGMHGLHREGGGFVETWTRENKSE